MNIEVHSEYSGTGATTMATILATEEFSKVEPALAILIAIHNSLVCNFIQKLGNEAQKSYFLPMLGKDKVGWCFF